MKTHQQVQTEIKHLTKYQFIVPKTKKGSQIKDAIIKQIITLNQSYTEKQVNDTKWSTTTKEYAIKCIQWRDKPEDKIKERPSRIWWKYMYKK